MFILILPEAYEAKSSRSPIPLTSSQIDTEDDETPASRFVARLVEWLIRGFVSKNRIVRFRAIAIVSEMISNLGEIEYVSETFTLDV